MTEIDDQKTKRQRFQKMEEMVSNLGILVDQVLKQRDPNLTEAFYSKFEQDYKKLEKDIEIIHKLEKDIEIEELKKFSRDIGEKIKKKYGDQANDVDQAPKKSIFDKMMNLIYQAMQILKDFIFRRTPEIVKEEKIDPKKEMREKLYGIMPQIKNLLRRYELVDTNLMRKDAETAFKQREKNKIDAIRFSSNVSPKVGGFKEDYLKSKSTKQGPGSEGHSR